MLIAEANVETERSSRYLVQLCRHLDHKANSHPDVQARTTWRDDYGIADFGWGRCICRADPGALKVRVEALDEEKLARVKGLVTERLMHFGRRDQLTVTWASPQHGGSAPAQTATDTTTGERASHD